MSDIAWGFIQLIVETSHVATIFLVSISHINTAHFEMK